MLFSIIISYIFQWKTSYPWKLKSWMVNSSVVFSEEPFLTTQRSNYSLAISSHQISDLFIQQTFFFFFEKLPHAGYSSNC